jgi:hypothetical protein
MKSGRRILAVLAGAAMLAMPVTAAAGHNREANNGSRGSGGFHASAPRTFAAPRNFSAPRANFNARANVNAPRTFDFAPARPAPMARVSNNNFFRASNQVNTTVNPRPPFAQARFIAPVAPRVWSTPAVAAPPTPYYRPGIVRVHHYEPDDDDYYGRGYYGGPSVGYDDYDDCPAGYYQGSYYAPSSYYFAQGPGESLGGYMNHLMYARQMAWMKYQNALARGDYKGAKHLYRAYVSLNNQIARVRGRVGYGGYGYAAPPVPPMAYGPAPYGPAPYGPPVAASPLAGLLGGGGASSLLGGGGAGYGNYGYNSALGYNPSYANYGNPGYASPGYANPGYGAPGYGYNNGGLTTMLGPLLQQFVH